jgi:hypothetical protein
MAMTIDILLQLSQIAILPALGYLIALERRLVKLETQLQILLLNLDRGTSP